MSIYNGVRPNGEVSAVVEFSRVRQISPSTKELYSTEFPFIRHRVSNITQQLLYHINIASLVISRINVVIVG